MADARAAQAGRLRWFRNSQGQLAQVQLAQGQLAQGQRRDDAAAGADSSDPRAFHRQLPGYAPTPLLSAPALAALLGVGEVLIKDESHRCGLPAYKVLGASWAAYRALERRLVERGGALERWRDLADLRAQLAPLRPLTLVAATDGNHGRAVARVARWLGLAARILVPAAMAPARRQAILDEGAELTVVDGSYDDAVAAAAELADEQHLVVADTAWAGYRQIPAWVVEGYSTIFREVDEQLAERSPADVRPTNELWVVQVGVGSLAAALLRHLSAGGHRSHRVRVMTVEPLDAACALASAEAGRPVTVPGPHRSIMAGLNAGNPSATAWPLLARGADLFVAVADDYARQAMRHLAEVGVVAGESGAAGLAGLLALREAAPRQVLADLGVNEQTRVLLLCTEADTDPESYRRIVGRSAAEARAAYSDPDSN